MSKNKVKTKNVRGINFQIPFGMTKSHFKKMYKDKFGDDTDEIFEELKKSK